MSRGRSLGVIGCGRMAKAILNGLKSNNSWFDTVYLYDINPNTLAEAVTATGGIPAVSALVIAEMADIILLAVKPAQISDVLGDIRHIVDEGKIIISVAAGVSIAKMENALGKPCKIVRVMPNTPCLIGQGVSALSFNNQTEEADQNLVIEMFSTLGSAPVIPESYMDAVVAVSGSGPAYYFLIVEAITDAAVALGLPRDLASRLAVQTMIGAGSMLLETGEHPAALRDQVTSPGGTTILALSELERGGVRAAFYCALRSAFERSKQLGEK